MSGDTRLQATGFRLQENSRRLSVVGKPSYVVGKTVVGRQSFVVAKTHLEALLAASEGLG